MLVLHSDGFCNSDTTGEAVVVRASGIQYPQADPFPPPARTTGGGGASLPDTNGGGGLTADGAGGRDLSEETVVGREGVTAA